MISLVDGILIVDRIPVTRGSEGNTILTTPNLFYFCSVQKTYQHIALQNNRGFGFRGEGIKS